MQGENVLQGLCSRSLARLKHGAPTILTVVGAIGVVATAVTAVRATPKALKLLEKAKEEKGEELNAMEVVKTAAPAYIPSVAIGASTIACMFGANVLNKRHQAALVSAYALVENGYKEYRDKLKELFGEEADIQIRDAIAKDKCNYEGCYAPGVRDLPELGGDTVLFYEENRGKYFESTIEAVKNAEYHFNRNLQMRGFANLNEFYELLGLEPTKEGEVLGWSVWQMTEGYDTPWLDFDHRLLPVTDDGLECYVISTVIPPSAEYEEY